MYCMLHFVLCETLRSTKLFQMCFINKIDMDIYYDLSPYVVSVTFISAARPKHFLSLSLLVKHTDGVFHTTCPSRLVRPAWCGCLSHTLSLLSVTWPTAHFVIVYLTLPKLITGHNKEDKLANRDTANINMSAKMSNTRKKERQLSFLPMPEALEFNLTVQ